MSQLENAMTVFFSYQHVVARQCTFTYVFMKHQGTIFYLSFGFASVFHVLIVQQDRFRLSFAPNMFFGS